jgi:molybdopterin converting factor small subunit
MPVLVPPPKLAKFLKEPTFRSEATTVAALLDEVRLLVPAEDWLWAQRAAILVNGRAIHRLRGAATPLGPDDQVWMIFPSAGG